MNMSASAYLLNRSPSSFPVKENDTEDSLFAGQRIDGETVSEKTFRHCTFANISFKEATIKDCKFKNCVFIDCYFRKTKVHSCTFDGSKFISCQFPKISINACGFQYVLFEGCVLPYSEMEHNLPSQPNIRFELTSQLSHAAEMLGLTNEARHYRLQSIKANEKHLWAAASSQSSWYKTHYTIWGRTKAFITFLFSKLKGIVWGYGENWNALLLNFVISTLLIFPFIFWLSRTGLSTDTQGTVINFKNIIWLSIQTILPINGVSDLLATSTWAKTVLAFESAYGILLLGLFVTLLLKTIIRR